MKGKAILGVGHIPLRSYWLTLFTLQGVPLWEGIVDAQDDGEGLKVSGVSVPVDIQLKIRSLPGYTAKWEPVWEEIPRKLLTTGSSQEG